MKQKKPIKNKTMKAPLDLDAKVKKSISVLKDAYKEYGNNMAIFWTGGKDSTVLLHMMLKTFGKEKFPLLYLDTQLDFEEVYDFIKHLEKEWGLDLITVKTDKKMMEKYHALKTKGERVVLASMFKIILLKKAVKRFKFPAIVIGIRWDEHKERIAEKYFSEREDHIRIHPLLHFSEKDIWDYTKEHSVLYISLYDKGYRSLGEKEFTEPSKSTGDERSGRRKEREVIMKRLRRLGYF